MQFHQFLTEVSTNDIIEFNKAAEAGEFKEKPDVREFFVDRGYKEIGYGLFAEVFQSKEHFVVKVASGDDSFDQYVKVLRGGQRQNPHFPRIIAQKEVTNYLHVYFIERLVSFDTVSVKDLVANHTKEDAGIFVWLIPGFGSDHALQKLVVDTAKQLDENFRPEDPPVRPDDVSFDQMGEYYDNSAKWRQQFKSVAEKMLPANHPFRHAVRQIENLSGSLDVHGGNVMIRKPSFEVVFTDPVA